MVDWREQYSRMGRWHYRLSLGLEHIIGGGDEAVQDVFYAFAQACTHLVDWLDSDRSQHIRRADAETYVESRPILAFCRDICNGSKHAQLQSKNVDIRKQKTTTAHSINDAEGQTYDYEVSHVEVLVRWGREFIGASNFADQCIAEWNRFLVGEGLLSSDATTDVDPRGPKGK
jgi:hypothetical protein